MTAGTDGNTDQPDLADRPRLRDASDLPACEPTIFTYNPVTVHDRTAYLAGQIAKRDGELAFTGRVGEELSLEDARNAARICAEQALAWADAEAGGLSNIRRILRVECFVAHADGFSQISQVAEAASGLLIEYLGDAGRHARTVIGVKSLPRNSPVLIQVTLALHEELS